MMSNKALLFCTFLCALMILLLFNMRDNAQALTLHEDVRIIISKPPAPKPDVKHIVKVEYLTYKSSTRDWRNESYLNDHYYIQPIEIQEQINCLALNIYHEAAVETNKGKLAVAFVTLNRMYSDRFPNSICGVVYDAKYSSWWKENHDKEVPLLNRCQFSWFCDGKPDEVRSEKAFETITRIATYAVLNYNYVEDPTYGAMWYHAYYVKPSWRYDFTKTATIGAHIFYRTKTNNEENESTNFGRKPEPIVFLAYR